MTVALREDVWCASTPMRRPRATDAGPTTGLRSVGAALDVLECFAIDTELGVSDIARRLGVAKSTAHRLLQTLVSRGFVEPGHIAGNYRLGLHLYELGSLAHARNELRHAALPTLRQVADTTGLSVNFAVPDGADIVFVERIEAPGGFRFIAHVGRRMHSHVTSSGKAIAAHNDESDRARRTAGFPPRAKRAIRHEADWDRCLAEVRKDGYALSLDESFEGAASVAVPVLRHREAVAAISVFGRPDEIEPQVQRLVPLLTAASRRIARAHG